MPKRVAIYLKGSRGGVPLYIEGPVREGNDYDHYMSVEAQNWYGIETVAGQVWDIPYESILMSTVDHAENDEG